MTRVKSIQKAGETQLVDAEKMLRSIRQQSHQCAQALNAIAHRYGDSIGGGLPGHELREAFGDYIITTVYRPGYDEGKQHEVYIALPRQEGGKGEDEPKGLSLWHNGSQRDILLSFQWDGDLESSADTLEVHRYSKKDASTLIKRFVAFHGQEENMFERFERERAERQRKKDLEARKSALTAEAKKLGVLDQLT